MTPILLIHHDKVLVPYYRLQNYKYLHSYLRRHGYDLRVYADGPARPEPEGFPLEYARMGFWRLVRTVHASRPAACVLVVNHRQPYFFPFVLFLRGRGVKAITWTHGTDLQRPSWISAAAHHVEHEMCDAIVLYAEHMREHLLPRHRRKAFVANNTLNLTEYPARQLNRAEVLGRHGIHTPRNIIFVGRVQARKRVHDLLAAFDRLALDDCGLIVVGPDDEGLLARAVGGSPRIFTLGSLYGTEALDLMSCADVYCIPGAIGLSIVDAMFCGLPVVTENVVHGPEIMYLHEGENGFIVPEGDIRTLADRLRQLLTDQALRLRFSQRARQEIATRGHIDELCKGVLASLDYAISRSRAVDGNQR